MRHAFENRGTWWETTVVVWAMEMRGLVPKGGAWRNNDMLNSIEKKELQQRDANNLKIENQREVSSAIARHGSGTHHDDHNNRIPTCKYAPRT